MSGLPSNQNDTMRDLLSRIDTLTQHIISIKGDMYKRSDFRLDSELIYRHISDIETKFLSIVRDAVTQLNDRIDDFNRHGPTEPRNWESLDPEAGKKKFSWAWLGALVVSAVVSAVVGTVVANMHFYYGTAQIR